MRRFRFLTIAVGLVMLMCAGCTATRTRANKVDVPRPVYKITFYAANGDTIKTIVTKRHPYADEGAINFYDDNSKLRLLMGTVEVEEL